MLVRRLEIQGFKSFAERIVVEFGPGATGIVGPNGAGKSNIADAIRWALGEQNPRALRSSRMEDVIFSGSEVRKPLGFAEAALTLDNEDGRVPLEFGEVSITRRLYRSGESEYLLNGVPARLRDITDLLAGTGLGREGYSLVGQGRIDEILMSSPESRRGLFDEACGIGLHRGRKREALARLEDVAARLERVSDVRTEIENQLIPLDRQAAVARAFVEYRQELERLELWLEGQGLVKLRGRMAAGRLRLVEIRGDIGNLRERQERLAEEVRTLRAAHSELGLLVEQKQQEVSLSATARRQEADKSQALERAVAERDRETALMLEERGRLGDRLVRATTREATLGDEATERTKRQATIGAELAEAARTEEAARQALAAVRASVETAKSDYLEATSQANAHRFELSTAEAEASRWQAETARREREAEAGRAELTRVGAEAAVLLGRLAEVEPQAATCARAQQDLESREDSTAKALSTRAGQVDREREALALLETERATLEAAIAAASAWSRSALAVVAVARDGSRPDRTDPGRDTARDPDQRTWFRGFVGVLGEELEIEPEDGPALEAALGRYAEALVVRTEDDLRQCLAYLRSEDIGPAVVVPIDLVVRHLARHGTRGGLSRGRNGVSLASRVGCARELRPVVDYLLASTVLVGDYDQAMTAIVDDGWSRATTREGLLVRPGGAVTLAAPLGGRDHGVAPAMRPGNADQTLTHERMRRLREVRDELDRRRLSLSERLEQRTSTEKDLAAVRSERSRLATRAQELAVELASLSARLDDIRRRELASSRKVAQADLDRPELEQRLLGLEARTRDLGESLRHQTVTAEQLRSAVSDQEASVRPAEAALATASQRLGELRVEMATLEERERAAAAETARLADEIAHLSADDAALASRLTLLAQEREAAAGELEALRQRLATATDAAATDADGDIEAWRQRRHQLADSLEDREAELDDLRHSLDESADKERREETRLARLEAEEELSVRRLRRDWGDGWEKEAVQTAEPATEDPKAVFTEEAAQLRVQELRRIMGGLGVVNIGAIEEHRRLSERVAFLRGQTADLAEARESLLRLVAEMDETMARKFEEGFLAVRRAFRNRVPELFGGGRGDLTLTSRDDLLESGVEILVEPPSKKLQSLALLSTGERAVSALALVLAFLDVRPAPFVVLDEIDAPLDDANVARFCAAIATLASLRQTQFILVTHNKTTMEIAESLYGVTMGEDGASRLVSVKLEERDEYRRRLEKEAS